MKLFRWYIPAAIVSLILLNASLIMAQSTAEDGSGSVFIPLVSSYEAVATVEPIFPGKEQVYGLLGRIEPRSGRRYVNYLITVDGVEYGLVGETPDTELEIDAFRDKQPPVSVKIWGVMLPKVADGNERLIVVSGVLETDPVPDADGQGALATVRFARVNLFAGPEQTRTRVGQVIINQVCDIIGRNQQATWWQLSCEDGLIGWIDGRLVNVQGETSGVPVVDVPLVPAPAEPTPAPSATPVPEPFPDWKTALYTNRLLTGVPVAFANVENIDFDWGSGAPNPAVPSDNFSLRFERTTNFEPGFYRFTAQSDDGVRVWLDGQLLIDEWHGASGQIYTANRTLSGRHRLRVEYYEAGGLASIRFRYDPLDGEPAWDASYYRGTGLQGTPVLVQKEPRSATPLDNNWVFSSPAPFILGEDFWSGRWRGEFEFDEGNYFFRAIADDGVRVYLDGLMIIDQWRDGYKDVSNRFVGVGEGYHTVEIEYYERSGQAVMKLWWYKDTSDTGPQ